MPISAKLLGRESEKVAQIVKLSGVKARVEPTARQFSAAKSG
jgi:hypothetical protein